MKSTTFENRDQWMLARQGKITGTRLKDIIVKRGTGEKKGYYELIAERLSVTEEEFEGFVPNETPMNRGTRLQTKALEKLKTALGKPIKDELVLWSREDNESIAVSPDGVIEDESAAVETKCLSSASHIEAWLTQSVPEEFEFQKLQYFIVNENLKKLYFCFYDPRIPCKDFFYFVITREEVQAKVDEYLVYQKKKLAEIDEIVAKLSNF